MPELHIKYTKPTDIRIVRKHCPTCEKQRFFVGWFEDWYGWYFTCLKCGEKWGCGEMLERPFCRGWREQNIESIKRFYRKHKALKEKK